MIGPNTFQLQALTLLLFITSHEHALGLRKSSYHRYEQSLQSNNDYDQPRSYQYRIGKDSEAAEETLPDRKPVTVNGYLKYVMEQNELMNQAKTTKALVKRFARFLRHAYPKEVAELTSQRKHLRERRRSMLRGMDGLFHHKTRIARPRDEKLSKAKGCDCSRWDEVSTEDEPDEMDKFRLFFSDPPLCRPTSTMSMEEMLTATDLCGHECQCHTEKPATNNDKEIFITTTTPKTTTTTLEPPTTACNS